MEKCLWYNFNGEISYQTLHKFFFEKGSNAQTHNMKKSEMNTTWTNYASKKNYTTWMKHCFVDSCTQIYHFIKLTCENRNYGAFFSRWCWLLRWMPYVTYHIHAHFNMVSILEYMSSNGMKTFGHFHSKRYFSSSLSKSLLELGLLTCFSWLHFNTIYQVGEKKYLHI